MNQEELRAKFEENVQYLRANIPPDDIYPFAEETFMAALFFLKRWSDWTDLNVEMENDPVARKWIVNILTLLNYRERKEELRLDLGLEEIDENNNP